MTTLFDPPPTYELPLVRGQDLIVDFKNRIPNSDPADYVSYDPGVQVALIIDTDDAQTVATAVIDGHHAVCRIESTVSDAIPSGKLWRCRITLPGNPTTDLVAMNGKTIRKDGKS